MLKTLLSQVKQYKLASILTPLCMIGEVICEMIIPVLMAGIVDLVSTVTIWDISFPPEER